MTRFASLGTGGGPDVWVRSRWVFNCYVFPTASDGAPLVIDCGLPSHAHQILRQFSPERATVVATHTHTDHVGGIPELSAIAPAVALPARAEAFARGEAPGGPRLATVASIAPVLRSQAFELSAVVEAGRATAVGFGLRGPYASPSPSPVYLADGPFDLADGWEAIATPGHTDDSTCLYHAGSRTLCSGDAVLTVDNRAWFNPERWDDAATGATEDRLRGLRVDRLLPGHGRPVFGTDLLATALSATERPTRRRWSCCTAARPDR